MFLVSGACFATVCGNRKYVDIYANESNPADQRSGGEDEERREAI